VVNGELPLDKESPNESLEESIFKTLSHQTRRDILRVIGEQKQASFTQIKNSLKIEDSASLSYHINALQPLITQKDGKYVLSELGQDAYALINKTTAYTESTSALNFLRNKIPWVIVANAVLWATALLLTTYFEGGLVIYAILSFVALWYVSNLILNTLLKKLGGKPCLM
jgi:DNA-binding transcriptional ArsR family regulator